MTRRHLVATATLLSLAACGSRTGLDLESGGPAGDAGGPTQDAAPTGSATPDAAADAPLDSPADSPPDLVAPRATSPLSTSRVTSRRPTLHWVLPSGVTDATVDLCLDRACTTPIVTPAHVTGSSYTPPTDLPVGVVFWRVHPSNATTVTSPTWQLTVGARSAPVDSSWGTTLDVNGDGLADVVVGAPQIDATGAAYVYLGSPSGLATMPATTLIGPDGGYGEFGWSVASAGDVNGDGFADLVVATRDVGGPGFAYVYLGSETGLATTPATTLSPTGSGLSEGLSVSSAGDVNGDGYADLVVGGGGAGDVAVYLGSSAGLATTPATTLTGTSDAGPPGFVIVAGAGDVNGDGFGDVVVAAGFGSWGTAGNVYVYLGSATGLAAEPAVTLPGAIPSGGGTFFDLSVASAGDVNGDGYGDVFVGACVSASCGSIYLGSASGVGSTPAAMLTPAGSAGGVRGASAGDVNGDGYGDVVVGASASDATQFVSIYLGSASGLATTATTTLTQPPTPTDGNAGSGFGSSLASAGDVNGDGFADVIVGEDDGTPSVQPDDTGCAYVYLGSAAGVASMPATALVGVEGQNGWFGSSVFGASD